MSAWWITYTKRKGGERMTNTKLLEDAIERSGLKKGYIAERLGVSRGGLTNLCNNRAEFKASQIQVLCDLLKLTDEQRNAIFFAVSGA